MHGTSSRFPFAPFPILAALPLALALHLASCAEKPAAQTNPAATTASCKKGDTSKACTTAGGDSAGSGGSNSGGDNSGGDNSGGDNSGGDNSSGGDTGGTDAAAFDLCSAVKAKASGALANEICANIATLRKAYYTGGGTQITYDPAPLKAGNKTTINVRSALKVVAKPADYFAMVKLEYKNPTAFAGAYEVSPDVVLTVAKYSDAEATFVYENNHVEASPVNYKATTKFITLKEGVAYLAATASMASADAKTIEDLQGLLVINKVGTSVEVLSASIQVYNNSGDHDQCVANAKPELASEQKRSYNNGGKADKAPGLLK